MKYDMTKKALELGLYTQTELATLRDTALDAYLLAEDIDQDEYDELMLLVIAAITV